MKQQRQQVILDIIQKKIIETQEDLLLALEEEGYSATQATISRDIKELALCKELVAGDYRYCPPPKNPNQSVGQVFQEGILSVTAAQNIVVVKTIPAFAMAVCAAFDQMEIQGNVGTLAGDDTCILIMTNNETALLFQESMRGKLL